MTFYSSETLISHCEDNPVVAGLYVYITYQAAGGVVGKAHLGTICNSDGSRAGRKSVNAWFGSDQITGSVSTGHNTYYF